ncbi:MAG: molybdopterin-guanine dinucleotide biosynthesis protein B [Anaeromyxobacteraceae bacterium]
MAPRRRRLTTIIAVSGPSGAGKTRLIAMLLPRLTELGLRVAVVKHSGHAHGFDVAGKDTEVLRRAGAVAAAITGPSETAWFGPPIQGARALARTLPPVDLVLAEGFKAERLPRVEVHRRRVSREFLCASDRGVIAIVTDEPPPRPLPTFDAGDARGLAELLVGRLRRLRSARRARR